MTIPADLCERIFMDADLESRKAKAKLDQIPDQPVDHLRLKEYLRLMKIGTALAVRENPDNEPPVPMLAFGIEPFLRLPVSEDNDLTLAWTDLDGNTIEEGGFMEPSTIHLNRIPIYQPVNEAHRSINSIMIADREWFTQRIAESFATSQEAHRLTRTIVACDVLMHEIKEMTNAGKIGAGSPEQEREAAG
jgi:hypothetical protein